MDRSHAYYILAQAECAVGRQTPACQLLDVAKVIKCRMEHNLALTHTQITIPIVMLHRLWGASTRLRTPSTT